MKSLKNGLEGAVDSLDKLGLCLAGPMFELCENFLDLVEVGTVGWRKSSLAPAPRMARIQHSPCGCAEEFGIFRNLLH